MNCDGVEGVRVNYESFLEAPASEWRSSNNTHRDTNCPKSSSSRLSTEIAAQLCETKCNLRLTHVSTCGQAERKYLRAGLITWIRSTLITF